MLSALRFVVFFAAGSQPAPIVLEPTHGVPAVAVRDPVLRIKPGAVVLTRTLSKPGDYYERRPVPGQGKSGPSMPKDRRQTTRWSFAFSAAGLAGIAIVSQAGHSRTADVADPNYHPVVAKLPKRLLPSSVSRSLK